MRVLVAHNRYRSANPSGENAVVDAEMRQLRAAGVEVIPYIRSSDEIDNLSRAQKLALPARPIRSGSAASEITTLIRTHRPDILHLHNPYPLISPWIVRVARRHGLPVIQTVHNHRHVCMKGTFFRDGHICHDCVGRRLPWPGVQHGCYQDSPVRSLPMAATLTMHRSTWQLVDLFVALTPQLRHFLAEFGIPLSKIAVKPNTVEDPGEHEGRGNGVTFIGRLSEEKGVDVLLKAWRRLPEGSLGPLRVVGEGPLSEQLMASVRDRRDVQFLGRLESAEVGAAIRSAALVVVPSTCPEAFPRVVVEALSNARPVLGTALGGLPGIIEPDTGWLVEPTIDGIATGLARVAESDLAAMQRAARERYLKMYHPDVVTTRLIEIYDQVSACSQALR